MKNTPKYYYMAIIRVEHSDEEGLHEIITNAVMALNSKKICAQNLDAVRFKVLDGLKADRGINPENMTSAVFLNIVFLGLMTPDEFDGSDTRQVIQPPLRN